MFANTKLKHLIDGLPNQDCDDNDFSLEPVEQLYTLNGDDYYCIRENFCFPHSRDFVLKLTGLDLTNYEWEGNEIFVSAQNIDRVIHEAIKVVMQLKSYLQITFSDIPFDIFLSADIENPDLPPSATIRFYKVREDYHIVTVEKMDDYFQPAGIFQLPESARPDINIL